MAAEPGPRYETNVPFPILLQTTDLIQLPHQWAPVRTSESTQSGEEETNEDNGRRGKVPIGDRGWAVVLLLKR
jgi:hypothetical protein